MYLYLMMPHYVYHDGGKAGERDVRAVVAQWESVDTLCGDRGLSEVSMTRNIRVRVTENHKDSECKGPAR